MSSNFGKLSFSFSKVSKKPALQPPPKETIKKIDKIEYIDSIENNAVQVINTDVPDDNKPLVIPLKHPNLLLQSVIDTVKSRKVEDGVAGKDGENENIRDGNGSKPDETLVKETLEEMAAREILEDATKKVLERTEPNNISVPLSTDTNDKQESTLEDYESIPVSDFGLAMLRGMGWDPKKGIGKNEKIVKVDGPAVRPKGLGLGADKAFLSKAPVGKNVPKEEVLAKGGKVRITFGKYKNLYGTVEGFDDDAGRVNVYMAISSDRVSINECFVQLVSADEFNKYSKVLNINAYNNYKKNETIKERTNGTENNSDEISGSNKNGKYGGVPSEDVQYRSNSSSYKKISKKYYSSNSESSEDDGVSNHTKHFSSSSKDIKSSSYASKSSGRQDFASSKHKYHGKSSSSYYEKSKYSSKSEVKRDKYSKRYSSDSDSPSRERYRKKTKSKDSHRERHRKSSSSSDYERSTKHKKNKKKKSRSRSRR